MIDEKEGAGIFSNDYILNTLRKYRRKKISTIVDVDDKNCLAS
jgi:hypothetical protein